MRVSALVAAAAAIVVSFAPAAHADAVVRQITDPADLIPGQVAQGQVGDWYLANDHVRVIIDDIPNPHGFANTGGNILDAATPAGEDLFASMFTLFASTFGRQADYDTATIVNAGGGANPAVLRVSGVDSTDPSIVVVTEYSLGPNDRFLTVTTTLTNNGAQSISQLAVGDALQWGLTTHFAPGHDNDNRNIPGDGYDIGGLTFDVPWVAGNGLGSSYGYTIAAGDFELSNGSTWSDPNVTYLDLPAGGGSAAYERFFIIGDGSLSSVSDVALALRSVATGTLSGTITETGTGLPVADADIIITTGQCLGTNGAVSNTIGLSATDGSYTADLEPGSYKILVKGTGRNDSACLDATVTSSGSTTVDVALSQQGTLSWSVSDGTNPLPAKISVLFGGVNPDREGPELGDTHTLIGGYAILSPSGSGSTTVPPGDYDVWVSRGVEYDIHRETVTVPAGGSATVNATLQRVVNSTGYLSADLHVHALNSADSGIPYEDRARQAAAEGLEVIGATDHDFNTDMSGAITATGLGAWVSSIAGNEITTNEWGHFNGFPLTVDPGAPRGGAIVHEGKTPAEIFGEIRADVKDPVVQINHPRAGGLGYFDLLALNPITGESAESDYSSDFDALEVFNGKRLAQVATSRNDWYRLLNRGQRVNGVGNTDTHQIFSQEIGYPRNFVQLGTDDPAALDEQGFADAVRDGRSFFTNGPFVELFVEGQPMGSLVTDTDESASVRVVIQAPAWVTIDALDIVVNGRIARSEIVPATGTVLRLDQTFSVPLARDSWIAVEVRGGSCATNSSNQCIVTDCPGRLDPIVPPLYGTDPVCPYAHTNPVWVDVDGDGTFTAPGNRGLFVEPIADVRGVDGAGNNQRLDEIVTVRGVATAPSYVFSHRSNTVYFQDESFNTTTKRSGGITTFQSSLIDPVIEIGDLIEVTGTIDQFNGLTELTSVAIDVLARERPVPTPRLTTIAELRNAQNDEQFEGMIVRVEDVSIVSGTWPPAGQDASITVTDPSTSQTITLRVDQDTNIDGTTQPTSPFDLVAVVGQFKFSSPYLGFYQLLPRQRIDIIESTDPLRILHGPASFPVTSCSATIGWYTTKAGDSVVEYGTSPAYGQTASDAAAVLAHQIELTSLLPDTTYHYRVITDGVASADRTFTTGVSASPSIVEGPVAARIDSRTVQVRWVTDAPSTTVVDYGVTPAYGLSASTPGTTTHHSVTLTDLEPGREYHFRVTSATSACGGGIVSSADSTFAAPLCENFCADEPGNVPEVSGRFADVPFTIAKQGADAVLRFEYLGSDTSYEVYASSDAGATQDGAYDAKLCDLAVNALGVFATDDATFVTFTLPLADLPLGLLQVVAVRGATEGPYGFDAQGVERAGDTDKTTPDDRGCGGGAVCATELFISEYVEGSSNSKAVEIANFTGAPVDLSAGAYQLQFYFNGSVSPGTTIDLVGVVADGDVWVVADNDAAAAILAVADQQSTGSFFNGDDAVVLRKAGAVIDVIGQIGFDPGSEWGSGLVSTADNTLRRKAAIVAGDTNASDAFDPALEWDGFAQNTFEGLGAHEVTCP